MAAAKTGIKSGSEKHVTGVFDQLGTKQDFVVADIGVIKDKNDVKCEAVICRDNTGYYVTKKSYVKASILDPYRQYKREELNGGPIEEINLSFYGVPDEVINTSQNDWNDSIREANGETNKKK